MKVRIKMRCIRSKLPGLQRPAIVLPCILRGAVAKVFEIAVLRYRMMVKFARLLVNEL